MQFAASDRTSRIYGAVVRHHVNAMLQLTPDGPAWPAIYDRSEPDRSPFAQTATVPVHSVSLCTVGVGAGGGDLAEGAVITLTTAQWPTGQRCRITTPVEPDAGGWAAFEVVTLDADADTDAGTDADTGEGA